MKTQPIDFILSTLVLTLLVLLSEAWVLIMLSQEDHKWQEDSQIFGVV